MKSLGLALLLSVLAVAACQPVVRNFEKGGGGGAAGHGGGAVGGTSPGGGGGGEPQCNKDADCASESTTCAPKSCVGKFCRVDFAAVKSSCSEDGGRFCDGKGNCVVCIDEMDCPLSPTLCKIPTCSTDGACGIKLAIDGATCADNGGAVCSKGACVPCNATKDCSSGNTCQDHVCVGECMDGMMNGTETSIDCGGGSCPPCAVGANCDGNNDCVSGAACINDVCTQCGANYNQPCGDCNGVVGCNGVCSIMDPPNFGQPCGQCGGTIECNGTTCSVKTPSNLGDDCTTAIHCPCGYNLPGEIDCAGKCTPTDSCSCCGQFPC